VVLAFVVDLPVGQGPLLVFLREEGEVAELFEEPVSRGLCLIHTRKSGDLIPQDVPPIVEPSKVECLVLLFYAPVRLNSDIGVASKK
jgi:hypothetical protein